MQGKVISIHNRQPVEGAVIDTGKCLTVTDVNGDFKLPFSEDGHMLSIRHGFYQEQHLEVRIGQENLIELQIA